MDAHLRWLRRSIARSALRRAAVVVVAGAAATVAVARWVTGSVDPAWVLAGFTVGQAVALVWFLAALWANPLTYRYLSAYVRHRPRFRPEPPAAPPHEAAGVLATRNLRRGVSTRDATVLGAPVVDLFQTPGKEVLAALGRSSGSLTLVSTLSDGRLLHTSSLACPPNGRLVVNTVPGAGPAELLDGHRQILGALVSQGIRPVPSSAEVWAEVAMLEREAYSVIGPVLGSLYSPSGGRAWLRLMARIRPDRVLALAMPEPTSAPVRRRRSRVTVGRRVAVR